MDSRRTCGSCRSPPASGASSWTSAIGPRSSRAVCRGQPTGASSSPRWVRATPISCCSRARPTWARSANDADGHTSPMSFLFRLAVITILAVVMALPALARPRSSADRFDGRVTAALLIVAGSLIVVGLVSDTLLRHVIQIAPLVIALALLFGRSSIGVSAAVPLFAFWLLIMCAIWLFLLGIARIFSGRFTPIEIALTIVIGLSCAFGLVSTWRRGLPSSRFAGTITIVAFAFLQFAAMVLSVQPFASGR